MKNKEITFEEIMEYHIDNRTVFESIVENFNSLVPFVGAGLSAFVHPLWCKFLENSFKKIGCLKKEEMAHFTKLLDEYMYEEAASFIKKERGKANFDADIKQTFASKNMNTVTSNSKQAVYLLPMLFKGLVLTTNFDQVLEEMYNLNNKTFNSVGHPGHTEMLNWALRTESQTTLYKFHGDISEVGKIVLTKESYDQYYNENSDLVKELSKCFKQKNVLFLGCSLNKDRTMTVLERVLEDGIINYAIVDSSPKNIRKKTRELGDMGIRSIIYPSEHYESVYIILKKLMEITNKTSFNKLAPDVCQDSCRIKLLHM